MTMPPQSRGPRGSPALYPGHCFLLPLFSFPLPSLGALPLYAHIFFSFSGVYQESIPCLPNRVLKVTPPSRFRQFLLRTGKHKGHSRNHYFVGCTLLPQNRVCFRTSIYLPYLPNFVQLYHYTCLLDQNEIVYL